MRLKIALAQIDQRVGDLAGNAAAMLEWRRMAQAEGADLVLFPELQLTGYPPEDLVLKPGFVAAAMEGAERLADATADGGPAMLFGSIHGDGSAAYNAMILAENGQVVARRLKHELPNYGTFDELRVFRPGPLPEPIAWRGVRLGVPICEDIWLEPVCQELKRGGAEILLVPNGSPYELHKDEIRQALVQDRVTETGLPMVYLNRVGGQDELAFDGSSFVVDADGETRVQMRDWDEALLTTEWEKGADGWQCLTEDRQPLDPYPEDVYHAMMVGVGSYVNANGFPGVIIGLSGGIDSALTAAVAVDALGADRVWCVMMPSDYTSSDSLEDAKGCAEMLGCKYDIIPIKPGTEAIDEMLGGVEGLAAENVQSRLRMVTLMALSNAHGHMLLTTGNKSEMSVGYATLYGDMAGGYNPLKDTYKTTVFALSKWRNANRPRRALGPDGPVMPVRVIDKPPSAELRHDQKDEDSLPPYAQLDRMLEALVEEEVSVAEAARITGVDIATVKEIERKLLLAEYKRRQAPPGVKIGRRNFGRDRRYPITNFYRSGA